MRLKSGRTVISAGKKLTPALNHDGYPIVNLNANGISKVYKVHRLVAIAFLKNPNNYEMVHHKDENKGNPCLSNLMWCSRRMNIDFSMKNKIDFNEDVVKSSRGLYEVYFPIKRQKKYIKSFVYKKDAIDFLTTLRNQSGRLNCSGDLRKRKGLVFSPYRQSKLKK